MNNTDKISKKIKALLERTVENGCTESEALTATAKVQELLNTYNLSLSEVEYKASEFTKLYVNTGKKRTNEMNLLCEAVGDFSFCKTWIHTNGETKIISYVFFGEKAGTETANFTFDLLQRAILNDVETYKKTDSYKENRKTKNNPYGIAPITLTTSFKKGMAMRLSSRLREMLRLKESDNVQETGIQLYNRMVIVEQKYTELNMNLGRARSQKHNIEGSAYNAGKEAADKVNISSGLKSDTNGQKRIG